MDFLKELIQLNNEIYLKQSSEEKIVDTIEDYKQRRIEFVNKFNKKNNRLFTISKQYHNDDYQSKIRKYNISRPEN